MTGGVPRLARWPVFGAAVAVGVLLSAFSAGYGYDRDELYFRLLPTRWGYVDQGPLTPLVARTMRFFVDAVWAQRIPATVALMVTVVIVAAITREVGGGRGAQTLAAWGFAFAAVPVIFGHVLLTASLDLPVWPAVMLFVIRAVRRDEGRWWLVAGAVAGISTYNKLLIATLLLSLAIAIVAVGPRRLLISKWVVGAAVVLVVLALPNLVYQVVNGWPELAMGRALADHNAADVRVQMWPFLALMLGPPLVPVWVTGLVWLWRRRELRFIAAAFPVLVLLVFAMGSQVYYPIGLVAVLFAVGCHPAYVWLAARRVWRGVAVALVAINAAVSLMLGLPLIPASSVGSTPIAGTNLLVQDSIGWPRYVDQIAAVYATISHRQQERTIVYASNYGEAGAVDRYGPALGVPKAYSGQNELGHLAPPPAAATTVILVGGQYWTAAHLFGSCAIRAHLDNDLHVDNEEQHQPVAVCRNPRGGWTRVWPRLRHLD